MKRKLEEEEGELVVETPKSKKKSGKKEIKVKEEEEEIEPEDVEEITNGIEKEGDEEEEEEVKEEEIKIIIDENSSLEDLLQSYKATLGSDDVKIFEILQTYHRKELEMMPLFGPKRKDKLAKTSSNPLMAHSARANTILTFLKDSKAFITALEYDEETMKTAPHPEGFYNLEFLIPILCHTLDEKNICDVTKVIEHGWVYFIMRGLSMSNPILRKCSFLAFKRLIFNFQQPKVAKNHNAKLWLHFLQAIKRGIFQLGECQLSHLISTWLVAAWEVLRQPSHLMYNRLTTFLLAKPILEVTIIPEFIPFYNASDGNKESREWILNVLYWGLKTNEDWKIAQKLPTLKFLCSSFLLEKIQIRKNIVGILTRGAMIPEVSNVMVNKYSLHIWVGNIVTNHNSLKIHLAKLFHALKSNCTLTSSLEKVFDFISRKIISNNGPSALNIESVGLDNVNEREDDDDDIVKEKENVKLQIVENTETTVIVT